MRDRLVVRLVSNETGEKLYEDAISYDYTHVDNMRSIRELWFPASCNITKAGELVTPLSYILEDLDTRIEVAEKVKDTITVESTTNLRTFVYSYIKHCQAHPEARVEVQVVLN